LPYDLPAVDTIRQRLGIGYEAAVQALDEGEGDVVRALAIAERHQRQDLEQLATQIREGVTRSLTGGTIGAIRWKVRDQVVSERPVCLSGLAAVVTGVLAILVSSSAIETAFTGDRDTGQSGS
jgi:hypothetical protein